MELYGQCSDKLLIGGLCVCVYVLLIKKRNAYNISSH